MRKAVYVDKKRLKVREKELGDKLREEELAAAATEANAASS
jgi:hypothetical protein